MFRRLMSCLCDMFGRSKYSGTISPQRTPDDEPMSYEMVFSWGQSMNNLLKYKVGQRHLAEFLKGEFSDENILFWLACEELKKENNKEKMEEKVRIIYEDFISILSPKEISLDSRVREALNVDMKNPTCNIFDDAQHQIHTLMERDSYPRFVKSEFYKNILARFGVTEETDAANALPFLLHFRRQCRIVLLECVSVNIYVTNSRCPSCPHKFRLDTYS